MVAAREEFGAGFTRTVTGNYVRTTEDGVRLVVFQKWGRWHWLMDDGEEPPRYSSGSCEEAESAVGDLFRVWAGVL